MTMISILLPPFISYNIQYKILCISIISISFKTYIVYVDIIYYVVKRDCANVRAYIIPNILEKRRTKKKRKKKEGKKNIFQVTYVIRCSPNCNPSYVIYDSLTTEFFFPTFSYAECHTSYGDTKVYRIHIYSGNQK